MPENPVKPRGSFEALACADGHANMQRTTGRAQALGTAPKAVSGTVGAHHGDVQRPNHSTAGQIKSEMGDLEGSALAMSCVSSSRPAPG